MAKRCQKTCEIGSCGQVKEGTKCPNDCYGNGKCMNDGTCSCKRGYKGKDCQILFGDNKSFSYCKNKKKRGWCTSSYKFKEMSKFCKKTCEIGSCGQGKEGTKCPNDCYGNGKCWNDGTCQCKRGNMGKDCYIACKDKKSTKYCNKMKSYGHCEKKSMGFMFDIMKLNCRNTCKLCTECQPDKKHWAVGCKNYKKLGYCLKKHYYYNHISLQCPSTCQTNGCTPATPAK